MSLSKACLNQYAKEDAIAQKWLLRGLLIAAGAHIGLIPLMAFIPPEVIEPPDRIALVVTGPSDPVEVTEAVIEEIPPEETVEALTEAVAQAELAAEAQISGGSSPAPPPPIASFQPAPPPEVAPDPAFEPPVTPTEPEPTVAEPEAEALSSDPEAPTETTDKPDSEVEADKPEAADEPSSDSSESEGTEDNADSVETATNDAADTANANLDDLRDRLRRARESLGDNENAGGDGDGETPTAPTETGTDVSRRTGPSEGSGSGSADGDGDSSGSSTVSCRKCDRPAYPEEALESGVEGSPSVSLEYDENGNVVGTVLEQSSGNAALDQAALEAARSYQLDSGGRSGSVSVEIDFGIEGSERSRAARQRGERESVTTPAPEREVVSEPVLETPAPAATTPSAENIPSPPEEVIGAPLPPEVETSPSREAVPEAEPPAPEPDVAPLEPSPPLESVAPPPEPIAPPLEPVAPPSEPVSIPDIMAPPEPALPLEPAPVPDIGPPE